MYTVKVTPQAAEDLLEIKNYIENELQNPIAAHNTVLNIVETYENLSTLAEAGIPVERYVPFPTDYKFVLANNYSIFYRIDGNIVRVIRIMYSKRDFARILFEDNNRITKVRSRQAVKLPAVQPVVTRTAHWAGRRKENINEKKLN